MVYIKIEKHYLIALLNFLEFLNFVRGLKNAPEVKYTLTTN